MSRECVRCGLHLDADQFRVVYNKGNLKGNLRRKCKPCENAERKRKVGITDPKRMGSNERAISKNEQEQIRLMNIALERLDPPKPALVRAPTLAEAQARSKASDI